MLHKNVIWLNGTFDVLHMGHIKLFEKAHEIACDEFPAFSWEIVVGVDTDERIREAKGDSRPVNNLWNRIDFLTSIKYVDRVHHFGTDDDLRTIIKGLSPRWMVIGNDYIGKEIIGREYIKEIIYVPRYQGLSSTKIISGAHN